MSVRLPFDPTPRERLVRHGIASLSDAELLSFFLCRRGRRAPLELAREALEAAGGLAPLVIADERGGYASDLLTPRSAAHLAAAFELARRRLAETLERRDVLGSPEDVRRYLALALGGREREVFAALFLDNRHRVIAFHELFHGTIDSAAVYPREVVKQVLGCNAAAVIFAHNHPSGGCDPSDADVRLTRKLVDALALVDVRVLDHLVVGQGVQTSLAERGLM